MEQRKTVFTSAKLHSPVACTSSELENVSYLKENLSKRMIDDYQELDRSESTTSPPRTL